MEESQKKLEYMEFMINKLREIPVPMYLVVNRYAEMTN